MSAEAHFGIIDSEMRYAAPELKQLLARVAVAFVLLDRVFDRLLREAVFDFECCDWKAVYKKREVEGFCGIVAAVAKLPGDREAVGREPFGGLGIAGRGRAIE
jgi:hypothetical protein